MPAKRWPCLDHRPRTVFRAVYDRARGCAICRGSVTVGELLRFRVRDDQVCHQGCLLAAGE